LSVLAGKDNLDSTSKEVEVPNYSDSLSKTGKIIVGIPQEFFGEGLNQGVKSAIEEKINLLSKNDDIEFVDIHLPHNEYSIATYYILTTAEASANLQRYDGVRYGFRDSEQSKLDDMYTQTRSKGFGDEVKRRIMLGTYVLSSGYYDAYYTKAQKVRRLIKEDFENAFKKVDVILTPTSPFTAFKIGEKSSNPLEMYLSDIYTTSANLAGIPGISIPVGIDSNGMPIGMQLLANQFNEEILLQTAKRFN
jgi:aspartyl-tRNA(Asn)/glutamyl-tRNA(Gln) amidotransferase subunit A